MRRWLGLLNALIIAAWRHDRWRVSLTIAAIALGVTLGVSVYTINFSATREMIAAARSLAGEADLTVRAGRSEFSEALYPRIAARPEVHTVSPALEIDVKLAETPQVLRILAIDPLRALALQPALLGDAADRILELLQPDAIMLSSAAAQQLGVTAGASIEVQVGLARRRLRVIAVLAVNESLRQPLALMDIASAQWLFNRLGSLTRLDIRLRPGHDPMHSAQRIQPLLPHGVQITEPAIVADQSAALSRAYRVNLNMLALISLLTGAVLVFSTQVLSLLRRRTHFALLRALGTTGGELRTLLTVEAAMLGVAAAVIGVVLGLGIAQLALNYAGADLGAGYFQQLVSRLHIDLGGLGVITLIALTAATLGGALPAWEAASAPIAPALRAGDEQRPLPSLARPAPGLILLALGALLLPLPSINHLPVFGYAAIACLLLGAMLLMPWFVRIALRYAPSSERAAARIAVEQLRAASGFAGISLATMLASLSLAVALLIMIHSFRFSLNDWLDTLLPADLYARAGVAASTWLDERDQQRIQEADGVSRAVFSRHRPLQLDAARAPVTLIARDQDPARLEAVPLLAPQRLPTDGSIPVWVSEAASTLYDAQPGRSLTLPLTDKGIEVTVAGVWRDYVRQGGTILITRADYVRITGDRLVNDAWIWIDANTTAAEVMAHLRRLLAAGPELELREPSTIRALSLALFDRTFAVTYALQYVALAIALLGVGIGFSAQALARRGEFGMLRHLGMTRREIGAMLCVEGALLGVLGALAGLVVGALLSYVLIDVINRQSFHWSMQLHWPWVPLCILGAALILACALTAGMSARRAMSTDALRSVREDW